MQIFLVVSLLLFETNKLNTKMINTNCIIDYVEDKIINKANCNIFFDGFMTVL